MYSALNARAKQLSRSLYLFVSAHEKTEKKNKRSRFGEFWLTGS